jgi:hypothetical protein
MKLEREEWDFDTDTCSDDRLFCCWCYEFAREAPWLVAEYRKAQQAPDKKDHFDETGHWQKTIELLDRDGDFSGEEIGLEIAPGFPDTPYLKAGAPLCSSMTYFPGFPDLPAVLVKDTPFNEGMTVLRARGKTFHLWVNRGASRTEIVKDFKKWVFEFWPEPSSSRRGQSLPKRFRADLKALGAYRLLRQFGGAVKAHAYTRKQGKPHGLFAKLNDYHRARKRAARILKMIFRA